MCAVKFLRLEDFLDDLHHGMVIHLEPQGILFAEVCTIDHHSKNISVTRWTVLKRSPSVLVLPSGLVPEPDDITEAQASEAEEDLPETQRQKLLAASSDEHQCCDLGSLDETSSATKLFRSHNAKSSKSSDVPRWEWFSVQIVFRQTQLLLPHKLMFCERKTAENNKVPFHFACQVAFKLQKFFEFSFWSCSILGADIKAPVKKPHYEDERHPHPAMMGNNSGPYALYPSSEERPPELPTSPPPLHPPTLSPDMEDVRVRILNEISDCTACIHSTTN